MLATLAVLLCAASVALSKTVEVDVPGLGKVKGLEENNARMFRSVPFAKQPVKERRFKYSELVEPWSPSVLDATEDLPGCPQDCNLPPHGCPPKTDEACLYLNIFTPTSAEPAVAGSGLPVMVFFHGGNLKQGYSGGPLYNGTALVQHGVIYVAANYRLGALGFSAATNTNITGSYGTQDQVTSLKWIQKYISAFGGDPDKVTIFGQSAGALSVAFHVTSPEAKGLFRAGIIQSDPFTIPLRTPSSANSFTTAVAKYAGCDDSNPAQMEKCLDSQSADAIVAAQDQAETDIFTDLEKLLDVFFPHLPIVDDSDSPLPHSVPMQPLEAFAQGKLGNDVPLIMDTVWNEAMVFIYEAFGKPVPALEYDIVLGLIFGVGNALKIGFQYPLQNDTDARNHIANLGTDALFTCATRHAALGGANSTVDAASHQPRYISFYDHEISFAKKFWGPNFTICAENNNVCHAADLPMVYYPWVESFGVEYTAAETQLSKTMQTFWTNFAKNMEPGSAEGLTWPEFKPNHEQSMLFSTPSRMIAKNETKSCDWWDTEIGYNYW